MSRYYVEINGVSSLTIEGLAIKTLPSIVKAPMRNLREEIDGRDGDIITNLGYGAYDKVLEIGLFGNYDIDKVIKFFNTEGTIVFSDEDDKVYNFKMLEQINYDKLIKFRQATITLHIQPFKYPLTETPVEITPSFVEDEAEVMSLINTGISSLDINLKGNTSQTGTPTPSSPIPVNVVSGDNKVVVCGKNLFNNEKITRGSAYSYGTIGSVPTSSGSNARATISPTNSIKVLPSTTYTLSFPISGFRYALGQMDSGYISLGDSGWKTDATYSFTTNATTNYIGFNFSKTDNSAISDSEWGTLKNGTIQLELGSPTTYETYTSQNYPIYLGVENYFNYTSQNYTSNSNTVSLVDNGIKLTNIASSTYQYTRYLVMNIKSLAGKSITLSSLVDMGTSTQGRLYLGTCDSSQNNRVELASYDFNNSGKQVLTTTLPTTITSSNEYLFINFYSSRNNTGTQGNYIEYTNIQLELGSKANSYTPYGTTPIELNKIGTYQDYIYKDSGKWYLHKEIEKVVLNGSENWYKSGNTSVDRFLIDSFFPTTNKNILSNRYQTIQSLDTSYPKIYNNSTQLVINHGVYGNLTLAQYKTWLETNNTTVYYVLATATDTEITNTTLINQLESIKGATSYEGQTNISQVNNDKPFILSAKALQKGSNEGTINNLGNIYSKPIIDIEGTGVVDIYLNGTQVFQVDTTDVNEIVIDSGEMEAYDPNTNNLANRKVVGDYETFKVPSGTNTIKVEGAITTATISKYTRWL